MTIIGLLNLQGTPEVISFIQNQLSESDLLEATERIYYSRSGVNHPKTIRVLEDKELHPNAKLFPPETLVWSFSCLAFPNTLHRQSLEDWIQYQVFFIISQWQLAKKVLEQGYDSYGTDLYLTPEPHYPSYCFWMTAKAMTLPRLENPYTVFHSQVNHHLTLFPSELYSDFEEEEPAPWSDMRMVERLRQVSDFVPYSFSALIVQLHYSKLYFDPQPSLQSKRPYSVIDVGDLEGMALLIPKSGIVDVIEPVSEEWKSQWKSLGCIRDLSYAKDIGFRKPDIVYTSLERIDDWLKKLSCIGVVVVKGKWQGGLGFSRAIGDYSLVVNTEENLP